MGSTPKEDRTPNEFRLKGNRYLYVDAEPLTFPGIGVQVLRDGLPVAFIFRDYDPQHQQRFFIHKPGSAHLTEMVDEGGLCTLPGFSVELLLTESTVTLYAPAMEDVELSERMQVPEEVVSALKAHFNTPVEAGLSLFRRLLTRKGILTLPRRK